MNYVKARSGPSEKNVCLLWDFSSLFMYVHLSAMEEEKSHQGVEFTLCHSLEEFSKTLEESTLWQFTITTRNLRHKQREPSENWFRHTCAFSLALKEKKEFLAFSTKLTLDTCHKNYWVFYGFYRFLSRRIETSAQLSSTEDSTMICWRSQVN